MASINTTTKKMADMVASAQVGASRNQIVGKGAGMFSNLMTRTKIILGVSAALALLAVVGATSTVSLFNVSGKVETLVHEAQFASNVAKIERDTLSLRRFVREFALTGDASKVPVAEAAVKALDASIEKTLALADGETRQQNEAIAAEVKAYEEGFAKLVGLRSEETKLITEKMDPAGAGMREHFETLMGAAAKAGNSNAKILAQTGLQALMQMRLNANKLIVRHNEELAKAEIVKSVEGYAHELASAMAGLDKATAGSPLRAEYDAVAPLIAQYEETFKRVEELDSEIGTLANKEMAEVAEAIAKNAEAAEAAAVTVEHAVKEETSSTIQTTEILVIALSVGGLGLGLILAWLIGGAIARLIGRITQAVSKLATGDTSVEIDVRASRDEIGEMTRAMAELKIAVGEAFKLGQMVDQMPINVMMADPNDGFKITYINRTSETTLRQIEKLLPVKAEQVLGSSVDIFHKNPAHQRQLLSNPRNLPHKANIKLGAEILELDVVAITDKQGNYVGPMLSWSIVTEKVKADAKVARLTQMVDQMPINVMMADPDDEFKIKYMNKTSMNTLRTIEKLLPVKAEQVLGSSVDIFHKNPSH